MHVADQYDREWHDMANNDLRVGSAAGPACYVV